MTCNDSVSLSFVTGSSGFWLGSDGDGPPSQDCTGFYRGELQSYKVCLCSKVYQLRSFKHLNRYITGLNVVVVCKTVKRSSGWGGKRQTHIAYLTNLPWVLDL